MNYERMTKRAAVRRMSGAKFTKAQIVRYLAECIDLLPENEQDVLIDAVAILRRDAGELRTRLENGDYDNDAE